LRGDHKRNDLTEIDIGQFLEFAIAQLFLGTEKASVDRFPVEALERFEEAALVVSSNGPNGDGSGIL
jgi:hypothetical protein